MRITPQTFIKLKHCYVNTVSNSKLMILGNILGVPLWELIFILERHRQINEDDKQHINKRVKALTKTLNYPPFVNPSNQPLTKRV